MTKIIVAHEGKQHSFKTAEALLKANMLEKYITTVYDRPYSYTRILKIFLRGKARQKCASRKNNNIPNSKIKQYCELSGLLLLFLQKIPKLFKLFPKYYDNLHDDFGIKVAKYAIKHKVDAVIMYDTNANSCFRYLKQNAPYIKRILDVTIGNRIYLQSVYQYDSQLYPEIGDELIQEQQNNIAPQYLKRLKEELELSEYFLAGSTFVKKSLIFSDVPEKNIFVLNYGVDLAKFKIKPFQQRKKPLRLLFVGNCSYRKGIHHLLKVVSMYNSNDIELNIAGGYNSKSYFYQKYHNYSNIKFLGFITRDKLASIYQQSDIFVLPSLAEGFALVSLEALSIGLPLLCTTNSGCNDIIIDGENGFVIPPSNESLLKEKIDWFLSNLDKLPIMGLKAHKSVEHHSWDDYNSNLVKIIKKII